MIYILIITGLLVSINAIIDAKLIKKNKEINHTLEYFLFFILSFFATLIVSILLNKSLSFGKMILTSGIISTIARLALFNLINYYERGLPLDYQSSVTTSIIDKTEHKMWDLIFKLISIRLKDIFLSIIALLIYIILIIISL